MKQLIKFFKDSYTEFSESHSNWATYISKNERSSSQITVDLNLINQAPITKLENVIYVSIKTPNASENGKPKDSDVVILNSIENQILDKLNLREKGYSFVGSLTSDNVRDFYFYGNNPVMVKKKIANILKKYPDFEFSFGYREDKNWDVYLDFLYPLPNQLQTIHKEQFLKLMVN